MQIILVLLAAGILVAVIMFWFCIFFDQAVLVRRGTVYRVKTKKKVVALTFDDGPSPVWTPIILDALKKHNIRATFFMLGYHVQKYPDIARRVVEEGHEIENHGYAHSVMLYYTPAEIEQDIKYTEKVIEDITGCRTKYFRPPKAWLRGRIKHRIKSMGYDVVLWSLNSKDWVSFHHERIVRFLMRYVRSGDIILFHDSGNVFSREGGKRLQTVKSVSLLAKQLKSKGFEFVTIEELVNG